MSLTFSPGNHVYRLDGKVVRGVTGLLDEGLPKKSLIQWSANFVSKIIADDYYDTQPPERIKLYQDLQKAGERGDLYDFLRYTPRDYKDEKAEIGTKVHNLAEQLIHGVPVTVPPELEGYVSGYLRFLERWQLVPIITERSVASRTHQYAGRMDLIAAVGALNNATCGIDLKTSNNVYSSTALQLAAYTRAEFMVTDDDPKTELPIPDVDMNLVVHITPDGTVAHILGRDRAEIDEAFQDFLLVAQLARRMKRIDGKWNPKTRKAEGSYLGEEIILPSKWSQTPALL